MLSTETPSNITKLPRPASASPLYRGFTIRLMPRGQRWTALIELPNRDHYTGLVRYTREGATEDAQREIDRIEAQRADPKAMPGCAGMMDRLAEGAVTR
jgi:hypothetical protein